MSIQRTDGRDIPAQCVLSSVASEPPSSERHHTNYGSSQTSPFSPDTFT